MRRRQADMRAELQGLQPFAPNPHQIGHMELTIPGVATLRTDSDQAKRGGGDAEAADVALAASGDGSAFERLYRAHVARVHSLIRRMIGPDAADDVAQDVFVLHDIEGYRHEEIADMLGIVPGTSKSQLHHARMALRKHLDR